MKEFYKSESESDNDDEDPEYLPEKTEFNEENTQDENKNQVQVIENDKDQDKDIENDKIENEGNENITVETLSSSKENFDSGIEFPKTQTDLIENQHFNDNKEKEVGITELNTEVEENESIPYVTELDSGIDIEKNCDSTTKKISEETILKDTELNIKATTSECQTVTSISKMENPTSKGNRVSNDYEFNIDDLEETDDSRILLELKPPEKENKEMLEDGQISKDTFKNDDLDKEIEAFDSKSIEVKKCLKLSELLKEQLENIKPRLSGTPDDVIDLESGVTKPKEIVTLMKRFERHTSTKKHPHKSKVHLK